MSDGLYAGVTKEYRRVERKTDCRVSKTQQVGFGGHQFDDGLKVELMGPLFLFLIDQIGRYLTRRSILSSFWVIISNYRHIKQLQ